MSIQIRRTLFYRIIFHHLDRFVNELSTYAKGKIMGSWLPFDGVHGTNACQNIYLEDSVTKADCPLKAGQIYWYKNKFHVRPEYPSISLTVRWALAENDKNLVCFELPAQIQ